MCFVLEEENHFYMNIRQFNNHLFYIGMTQAYIFNRRYTSWNTSALQVLEKRFPKIFIFLMLLFKHLKL